MFGIITGIIWLVFIVNLFALIGCIGIARFLFSSNIPLLGALLNPQGTSKFIKRQAKDAVSYAKWMVGSAVVLILLYL